MRTLRILLALGLSNLAFAATAENDAPKHEVGLTLGGLLNQSRSVVGKQLDLGTGLALQANYGLRLWQAKDVALYGEVHFLANPQRVVSSADSNLTRDVATIFLTPGIRVKFFPSRAIAPF